MAKEPIPPDVGEFIVRHINSVAQLEALLLLRTNPDKDWDAAEIAKRLYTNEREITEILTQLCEDGLLRFSGIEPMPRWKNGWSGVARQTRGITRNEMGLGAAAPSTTPSR